MTAPSKREESAPSGNHLRRRARFTIGDRVALALGALLVVFMISWISVRVAQNVIGDRAVAAGRQPAAVRSH